MKSCPVCNEEIKYDFLHSKEVYSVDCPRCGRYYMDEMAFDIFPKETLSDRQRANMSGWLFENQKTKITKKTLDWLSIIPTPSFHERADKILAGIEMKTEYAGQTVNNTFYKKTFVTIGWCINEKELDEIYEYLNSTNRIHLSFPDCKILPDGWAHLERLKKLGADSDQCFVAMWFDDKMKQIYNDSISKGILDAGYKPHRVDQREHNDKIDDEIIAQIRRSHFVLADFTGHRGGVYYEAGFAKGLGLEVIWTCREDEIDNLHFDIRQYNCILWTEDKLDDFKKKIQNRIERIFGRGSYTNEA